MQFQKITIVGVGLLGGSIGLAVRQRRLAAEVAGYVRQPASLRDCERAAAVDYATQDLLAAVSQADLVILCTPLARMPALVDQLLPALKRGAIVTDVGSVKGEVVAQVEARIQQAGAWFIGSHPMAGGEKTGVLAARADLFEQAACVITPTIRSNARALKKLEKFWQSLGARTLRLDAAAHDAAVAHTSHLPHVAAAALAGMVLAPKAPASHAGLCATGFRDTTRLAAGSPEMWRDIALANRRYLRRTVAGYIRELQKFQARLARGDARGVERFFADAKARRDQWAKTSPAAAKK